MRGDAIVNITSQHGMIGAPNDIAYGTGKAVSVYLTRQIATDYGREHIVCNAVRARTGRIVTGKAGVSMDPRWPEDRPARARPIRAWANRWTSHMPRCSSRLLTSAAISGVNLMCDGGWSAS